MRFGISTHLYHDQRLAAEHLAEIASFGFEAVELFATRSHFDYHDRAAIEALAGWLRETGLDLHGIHAPIAESMGAGDRWGPVISNAVTDSAARHAAVRETDRALDVVRRIGAEVVVVHLGTPASKAGDNNRGAAVRSLEEICGLADGVGVQVAVEVIPNELSSAAALAAMLDRDLDGSAAGICFDFGHARLLGDVPDAIEAASEHVIATHVHDNHGRTDEHLVPFDGSIDWNAALMSMQKIGYEGTYLMELANTAPAAAVLESARRARQRFEQLLTY
ncbi:MAG TPA: sugar phosphate isomerase/epimerase family protein [Vicinamibacterales bacterium]|nr:sugar phosphate isomerase/epimerase family protein [Vicinamibacterales bacterium]